MRVYFNRGGFSTKKILLTGIQPTGQLHIGNYLGSVKNMLKLQQDSSYSHKYLMIADHHSLTTAISYNHSKMTFNHSIGKDTITMARILLGAGVNPQNMCLFVQSSVSAHCELAWILGCISPQHWLNTMIQFKQKSHEQSSVGLYTYPILMAVDILLYRATHVPVGVDQKQHLQLTNRLVDRFRQLFQSDFFPDVNYVEANFPKIMSLTDPNKKMSKSQPNVRSRISLTDGKQAVSEKIRRAVTDSQNQNITFDPENRPGLANLIRIYSAFSNQGILEIIENFQKNRVNIKSFKELLKESINMQLQKIQNNMSKLTDNDVKHILQEGAKRARAQADKNIKHVKNILNLYQ